MLASIDFHNQIGFTAGEVCEIRTDRQLTNKLVAIQSPSTQLMPKPFLGIVLNFPQLAGSRHFWLISSRMALPLIRPSGTFSP